MFALLENVEYIKYINNIKFTIYFIKLYSSSNV